MHTVTFTELWLNYEEALIQTSRIKSFGQNVVEIICTNEQERCFDVNVLNLCFQFNSHMADNKLINKIILCNNLIYHYIYINK